VTARRNTSGAGAYRGRRTRRLRASNPTVAVAAASVDINVADARALEEVPGIGRSIAGRIVELRDRDGTFASLDELLDVAGMTQTRLERARPFLQPMP
jgi:competence protein ComEA